MRNTCPAGSLSSRASRKKPTSWLVIVLGKWKKVVEDVAVARNDPNLEIRKFMLYWIIFATIYNYSRIYNIKLSIFIQLYWIYQILAYARTSIMPMIAFVFLSATEPRNKNAPSTDHTDTTSVSPGNTWPMNLEKKDLTRLGSLFRISWTITLATVP